MGAKVNEQIETKVYINSSGKTVTYTVYDEGDVSFATGTMDEMGSTGAYTCAWTPDATGQWLVLVDCDSPYVHLGFIYHVGVGQEADIDQALGSEFDGSPDVYDVLVTGFTNSVTASKTGSVLELVKEIIDGTKGTDAIYDLIGTNDTSIDSQLATIDSNVDAILTDTSSTLDDLVDDLEAGLWGAGGIATFPSASAPGDTVSLAEVVRAIYDDTHELQSDDVPGLISTHDGKLDVVDGYHDVATANATTNAVMSDVIGNKADVSIQDADSTTKSIMALLKGVLDVLVDTDGISTWSGEQAPANNVSLHEVIQAIYNDTHELQVDNIPGSLTTLSALVDDLEGRLTAARAGYMDNIDNANLKTIADISTLNSTIIGYLNNANLGTIADISSLGATRIGYLDQLDFNLNEAIAAIPTVMVGTDDAALAVQIGSEFDGTQDLYDVLVTGGIPVWAAAAAPVCRRPRS